MTLPCIVYRARRYPDTYVFVSEREDLGRLPEDLRARLGVLDVAMRLVLDQDRQLARIAAREVIRSIEESGFYLQLPPDGAVLSVLQYGGQADGK